MERVSSVFVVLVTVLVTVTSSTRCYMCRDVTQRSGNRRAFKEHYAELTTSGWIVPCSDESFVVFPQVGCMKRTYITYEMCFPNKKCTVKVTERYPVLPPAFTIGQPFWSKPFREGIIRNEKPCQSDLCNGEYKNEYKVGLKCYHQCGRINLYGLTKQELANYDLPVIPCDETTYNYCGNNMECGYIVGSAVYSDDYLGREITVEGWYADCFYKDSNSIDHVLVQIRMMMEEHPDLQISPDDLTKCDSELCNHID